MPILAAETAEFPGDLFHHQVAWQDSLWWAMYTKPRQEKSLARDLLRLEIPFYLPLVPRQNLIRGREMTAYVPLFAGYVFVFASDEQRIQTLATRRVAKTVEVRDADRLVQDLQKLRTLIACGAPLTIESKLSTGRRVRVRQGLMRGQEGTVIERRGQKRLLVAIDFLQQSASMAIEDYLLEPID